MGRREVQIALRIDSFTVYRVISDYASQSTRKRPQAASSALTLNKANEPDFRDEL
jgi:hypothetical protein